MFWRPVEVAQIKTTNLLRVVVAQRKKNSIVPEGKAINAYGWNFSLLSSSYQPQCRYASHMCLLENAQHERIFKVDLREQSRASIVLFIAIVLFSRIKSFPRNLCLRSSKNSSSVLKLETWSSKLDSRNLSLETRFSILENFENRESSFESRLSTYLWAVLYIISSSSPSSSSVSPSSVLLDLSDKSLLSESLNIFLT